MPRELCLASSQHSQDRWSLTASAFLCLPAHTLFNSHAPRSPRGASSNLHFSVIGRCSPVCKHSTPPSPRLPPHPTLHPSLSGIEEHGGKIIYKANVREIITESEDGPSTSGSNGGEPKRRATGVKLADGRVFRGKVVVSNATRWVWSDLGWWVLLRDLG